MCPDHRAIDHVGGGIASRRFGQRLEHRIEHAGRDPSSVASENAVPLAIVIPQRPPLRSGSRDPHHAFEIQAVVLCRTAPATALQCESHVAPTAARSAPIPHPLHQSARPRPPPKGSPESKCESHVKPGPRNLVGECRYGHIAANCLKLASANATAAEYSWGTL